MICPNCSTQIPNGLARCPACHADLRVSYGVPTPPGRWCPSCGSAVPDDAEVCPHCSLPLEGGAVHRQPVDEDIDFTDEIELDDLLVDEKPAEDTRTIPRIESAIPGEDDPNSKVAQHEGIPNLSRFIFAAVAALLFVCGLALAIVHPWDRSEHSIRATEEADTSKAGFPGTKESLKGQDTGHGDKQEVKTGDETTYENLVKAYETLGSYSERADASEKLLFEVGFGDSDEEREKGKGEAEQLALDVSNLIADVGKIDVTSGLYTEQRDNINTLANWLRNRVDAIYSAWGEVVDADDPESVRQTIEMSIKNKSGKDVKGSYGQLFAESYDKFKPERKESESQKDEDQQDQQDQQQSEQSEEE